MTPAEIEMKLLMRQALKPRKTRLTDADYKRKKRAKAEAQRLTVGAPVSAETMDNAVIDAVAALIRAGDPDGVAQSILKTASTGFRCPAQAEIRISNRLKVRKSRILPDNGS